MLYKAYITRASSGRTDNQPVIEQILALRREQAMLLNYTSYTDYALADRVSTPSPGRQPSCVLWMSCRVSFPHYFTWSHNLYVSLPDTPQVWCMCRARMHCLHALPFSLQNLYLFIYISYSFILRQGVPEWLTVSIIQA